MSPRIHYKQESQLFEALVHPIGFLIVERLLGKKNSVNNIQEIVNVSQPSIHQNLNVLQFFRDCRFASKGQFVVLISKRLAENKKLIQTLK